LGSTGPKAVETPLRSYRSTVTGLKPGVNHRRGCPNSSSATSPRSIPLTPALSRC